MSGSYTETMWSHANVDVPLAHIKPMGDCVLVRVLPEEEVTASGIVLPNTGKDSSELRFGEVVAAGPGDRAPEFHCKCRKGHSWWQWRESSGITEIKCPHCNAAPDMGALTVHHGRRHPMHVKPGDRIWYRRVLANQQLINGELYQLIHEEAHIWAVLEN